MSGRGCNEVGGALGIGRGCDEVGGAMENREGLS